MPDFTPCRMCGKAPKIFKASLLWSASCCGELAEAFTVEGLTDSWNAKTAQGGHAKSGGIQSHGSGGDRAFCERLDGLKREP